MGHSFEVDIAVKYGVNAAILLNNIFYWIQKNRANKQNFYDGCYWTYNSRSAFVEIFPYFSERQIKTALDKLISDGVIKTGCYNKDGRDRSLWYALTEKGWCIMQKCQMHMAEMSDAHDGNVRPLPDINTDIKPDSKPNNLSRKKIEIDAPFGFMYFWNLYPRKVSKQMAIKAWKKLGVEDSKSLIDTILADVKRRSTGEWKDKDVQYIPHPSTYLNQRRWEDETTAASQPIHSDYSYVGSPNYDPSKPLY